MNHRNEFCPQALEVIEDFCIEHNMVDIDRDLQRQGESEAILLQAKWQSKQSNTKAGWEEAMLETWEKTEVWKGARPSNNVNVQLLDSNCFSTLFYYIFSYLKQIFKFLLKKQNPVQQQNLPKQRK